MIDLLDSSRNKKDWMSSANMISTLLTWNFSSSSLPELEKAEQLIDCLDKNSMRLDIRSLDSSLRYRFPEQNPDPLIKTAEEKSNQLRRHVQEMIRIADEIAWSEV